MPSPARASVWLRRMIRGSASNPPAGQQLGVSDPNSSAIFRRSLPSGIVGPLLAAFHEADMVSDRDVQRLVLALLLLLDDDERGLRHGTAQARTSRRARTRWPRHAGWPCGPARKRSIACLKSSDWTTPSGRTMARAPPGARRSRLRKKNNSDGSAVSPTALACRWPPKPRRAAPRRVPCSSGTCSSRTAGSWPEAGTAPSSALTCGAIKESPTRSNEGFMPSNRKFSLPRSTAISDWSKSRAAFSS